VFSERPISEQMGGGRKIDERRRAYPLPYGKTIKRNQADDFFRIACCDLTPLTRFSHTRLVIQNRDRFLFSALPIRKQRRDSV
jgi:hypothetical protein